MLLLSIYELFHILKQNLRKNNSIVSILNILKQLCNKIAIFYKTVIPINKPKN
jgi:hypothetical protein